MFGSFNETSLPNLIIGLAVIALFSGTTRSCDVFSDASDNGTYTALNMMSKEHSEEIDRIAEDVMENYKYISIGVIRDDELVLIRSFGEDRIGRIDEYASVTKPVTSMITMQLLEKGKIKSLDDPIGDYDPRYRDVLPEKYPDVEITFAHLLSHRSGIPHQDRIWKDGKLDLAFAPGESIMYSTRGYGVLGDVLEELTGKSYNQLVKEYIGDPVGAGSIKAPLPFFEAPGGLVQSTITDMALFALGVMDATYVCDSIMFQLAWKPIAVDPVGIMGMGWYISNPDSEELTVYHAGSNGRPRAFIMIRPPGKTAIVLLAKNRDSDGRQELPELAEKVMDLL
ncbi:MAG TPA: class A beta-lactamase-related serine hydrolase [Bacteroides sp.]|nr:class A beta-lactamase-related serine hydrolase [Bacteroides sp.]